MAISAYVGLPGSGKSYEVIANVIIPAYINGRRIVTNIYGISGEKIKAYCINKNKADAEKLGEIIFVENEKIKDDLFFPFKTETGISDNSFCRAGDLICIDEAWRIWENDKIAVTHRSFIAEHRHFANEQGITCDLVVINQSVVNLPRFIKDRIETTYRMTKLVALGLRRRYRVDVFSGIKLFRNNLTTSYQCRYDSAIFPLYQSYEGGNGQEQIVDKRQSVFSQGKFWFIVIGLIFLMVLSLIFLIQFFNGQPQPAEKKAAVGHEPQNLVPMSVPVREPMRAVSDYWRIAGKIERGGQAWIVLLNNQGQIRLEPASQFNFQGLMISGQVDDSTVTTYSGTGANTK
ncbi:zonular occludens toxin family protein [Xenorhabdus sp. SGI246]|uniref:zonular occludens toxin family protein n=1 Tax=Xenorhabdus sp. SGI246 TaxID=3158263 RepID=UPI00349F3979